MLIVTIRRVKDSETLEWKQKTCQKLKQSVTLQLNDEERKSGCEVNFGPWLEGDRVLISASIVLCPLLPSVNLRRSD